MQHTSDRTNGQSVRISAGYWINHATNIGNMPNKWIANPGEGVPTRRLSSVGHHRHSTLIVVWLVLVLVTLLITSAQSPRAAEIPCTRPIPPTCLEADVTFADGSRMRSCRSQILLYVDAVKTYLGCLADEHYRIESELQTTIRAFNCRLAGQTNCQ